MLQTVRFIFIILSATLIIGACVLGADIAKELAANTLTLGAEVQTTDKYEQIFNDSFEGNVIKVDNGMRTVRDMNGTERAFDRHWLQKAGVD